ncbi:DUF2585 domain-containing protein [Pseudoroseomonas cervicalis]|uniref:DUF2585 domain-containing protein n=1 Tax=Teichococcus cervicalis TaxID=204525 RepID=UPI0027807AC6|nr:DUF2585 domain-containing protein [Pseudoroseomonas cervicalis]MDQ1079374.1 hypothetical protein [Pseudoroseomonas cervicalis]
MRRSLLAVLGIALVMALVLYAMGRNPICECGHVSLWHGAANDAGTSQHIADWYTPSHILHGLIFYALLAWLLPRRPVGLRLVLAALVEAAWEIAENSPAVIERYRSATAAAGYTGDSILNSVADYGWMLFGFWLAAKLPWRVSLLLGLAMELVALIVIRDNLTLNVLMLLWPVPAIRDWQAGL